jgi:hypothetical protein
MTTTNRVRLSSVKEVTLGVTPGSPRMRTRRFTAETLKAVPSYGDSNEIRPDRMNADPFAMIKNSGGGINGEFSYPVMDSPFSVDIESAMFNPWTNTPTRYNDGVADSVITDISATVATVITGDTFQIGHLVNFTGFAVPGNNGVKRCTAASATAPTFTGGGLAVEAAPPAEARMKVVGFQGAAGDITATAIGLASTALNFTTLGLQVGQWVKVGGTAAGDQFATAANNGYARIIAFTATALTLDNLPAGWAVDAGATKTIKVWHGDFIKNGIATISQTIEKGFMGQQTPSYLTYLGQVVDTFKVSKSKNAPVTMEVSYKGMSAAAGTVSIDATPDPQTTNAVMAAHSNINRIGEAGQAVSGPSWVDGFEITINNNLRTIEDISQQSPVNIEAGECTVTGNLSNYFGNLTVYNKFLNGTPSSLNSRVSKNNQTVIFEAPRITYREGGDTSVSGKNADVMLGVGFTASIDTLTNAHVIMNRMEYVEG